jgi:putative ABC transport system substrate-binding protein
MTFVQRLTFRITFLTTLLILLVNVRPLAQAANNRPIILVTSQDSAPYKAVLSGFRRALSGQNIETTLFEEYSLQGDPQKAKQIFTDIKSRQVALILTVGSLATQVATQEASTIPIVASMILNADEIKQNPNATGVILDFPLDIQLQWLQKILPQAKVVGVLFNPQENRAKIDAATKSARSLGLTLFTEEVATPQALPEALDMLARQAQVLWGISDQTVLSPQTAEPLLLFSFRNRIPFIGLSISWAKAGAFYALDRDYLDIGMQCGEIAVKILQGVPVQTIPPTPPRKVIYAVNKKIAEHMKIDIPQDILKNAQQIFE